MEILCILQLVRGTGWPASEPAPALPLQLQAVAGLPGEAAGQLAHVDPSSLSMLLAAPATPQQASRQHSLLPAQHFWMFIVICAGLARMLATARLHGKQHAGSSQAYSHAFHHPCIL